MNEQFSRPASPPPNYLVFAILVTIFCCQVLGIVSIVFAAQVNSKWSAGDREGALNASRNAKLWAWIGLGAGLTLAIIGGLFALFAVFAGFSLGGFHC